MSLTRDEWEKMWKAVKQIENDNKFLTACHPESKACKAITRNVAKIKQQIQSVIGQME